MRKKLLLVIISLITLLCCSTQIYAQDCLYLDYCQNNISSTGKSKTGKNKNIEAAIFLTSDMLKPFVGCQLSGVMAGMPTDGKSLPNSISSWLRVDDKNATKASISDDKATEAGWNRLDFTSPYTITGKENGIYVGFRYYQETTLNCLSVVGNAEENSAWIGTENITDGVASMSWVDVHKTLKGGFSIRAVLTGNIPQADIALTNVRPTCDVAMIGNDIVIVGEICNKANKAVSNPVITFTLNGEKVGEYIHIGELKYEDSSSFSFSVPTTNITSECTAEIELSLSWPDETVDDNPSNNSATVKVEMLKNVHTRKMVCEEATGTWCGFCVRGYVGLKKMKEKYPDRFIGIGVHNGDEFVYAPYDNYMATKVSGYPSGLINRDGKVYDPDFSILESALSSMNVIANCGIDVKAYLDNDILYMASTITADIDFDNEISVAFVVLEDGVLTHQKNYYAGGGYGPMDGFENESSSAEVIMNDAARYISNVHGESLNVIPQKGNSYNVEHQVDLNTIGVNKVVNTNNLSVVAFVIDPKTGEILNAEITDNLNTTAINDIISNNEKLAQPVYDLTGRKLTSVNRGFYIKNSKKYLK